MWKIAIEISQNEKNPVKYMCPVPNLYGLLSSVEKCLSTFYP